MGLDNAPPAGEDPVDFIRSTVIRSHRGNPGSPKPIAPNVGAHLELSEGAPLGEEEGEIGLSEGGGDPG